MVEFRLIEGIEDRVHPFKHHTKRRGDRAGTRFDCEITTISSDDDAPTVVYFGEVMLANWSDGSQKGQSLKLWIDDEANVHPFAGYQRKDRDVVGTMFAAAFWELDDDNSVIDQDRRGRVERAHHRQQTLSQVAFMIGRNDRFHLYLSEKYDPNRVWDEESSAKYIRWMCHPGNYNSDMVTMRDKANMMLDSRSELDRNEKAATLFHEKVRKPFAKWGGLE